MASHEIRRKNACVREAGLHYNRFYRRLPVLIKRLRGCIEKEDAEKFLPGDQHD